MFSKFALLLELYCISLAYLLTVSDGDRDTTGRLAFCCFSRKLGMYKNFKKEKKTSLEVERSSRDEKGGE